MIKPKSKSKPNRTRYQSRSYLFSREYFRSQIKYWMQKSLWNRLVAWFMVVAFIIITVTYSVASWYIYTNRNKPIQIGATFVPNYARYFGLDPKTTYSAMLDELGFKRMRLVSYWSNMEREKGIYDFSELDWQFQMSEERGVKVSLSVGLRQPRWPECHMPSWAEDLDKDKWYPELVKFMKATVERYKSSPVLESYQLENEFLLEVFGDCPDHDRQRLIDEYNLLKSWDDTKPIVVTRSNNATPSWPVGKPRADLVGAAVYKRVWDKTVTKRYFEYPLPSWYYAFLAGGTKLTTGRETILHELQTEPWLQEGHDMRTASISEQNQTMDADRLRHRIEYARATGMKTIDLWGVEWWYYRKVNGDDSLWKVGQQEIQETVRRNSKL